MNPERLAISLAFLPLAGAAAGAQSAPASAPAPPSTPQRIEGVAPMGEGFVFTDPNSCCLWTVKPGEGAKIFARGEAWPRKPLYRPSALAFDLSGGLVVTDYATGGVIPIKADGSLVPSDAPFEIGQPRGIVFDKAGNLFVAGSTVDAVFRRGTDGKWAKFAGVRHAWGLALLEDGTLLVASPGERAVFKVSADGKTVAPLHKGPPLENPQWLASDGAGNVLVSDNYVRAVFKLPVAGGAPTPLLKGPPLDNPAGLWFDAPGKRLLLADAGARAIFEIGADGKATPLYQAPK